jgi:hypothetical protein
MVEAELFVLFTGPLEKHSIPYMITGSVAGIVYGEPRLTFDIDIVTGLSAEQVSVLPPLFAEPDFYCPPLEVLRVEASRSHRGHVNLIHVETGFKADLYFAGSEPLQAWGLERIRTVELDGSPLRFAPPEYVILKKLQFFREGRSPKHLTDIRSIVTQQGAGLDLSSLEQWVETLELRSVWNEVGS